MAFHLSIPLSFIISLPCFLLVLTFLFALVFLMLLLFFSFYYSVILSGQMLSSLSSLLPLFFPPLLLLYPLSPLFNVFPSPSSFCPLLINSSLLQYPCPLCSFFLHFLPPSLPPAFIQISSSSSFLRSLPLRVGPFISPLLFIDTLHQPP